jgi:uncharacterized RDD family membrane protein YckC
MLLAMLPVAGMIVVAAVKILGIGAGVFAVVELFRRSRTGGPSAFSPASPPPDSGISAPLPVPPQNPGAVPADMEATALSPVVSVAAAGSGGAALFWPRAGAVLIDFLLVAVLFALAADPLLKLSGVRDGFHALADNLRGAMFLFYLWIMWATRATSIGKAIFRLSIRRSDGIPVQAATAAIRMLGFVVSSVPLCLGHLWCLWDPKGRTWHDMIAGTEVVRVPKATPLL